MTSRTARDGIVTTLPALHAFRGGGPRTGCVEPSDSIWKRCAPLASTPPSTNAAEGPLVVVVGSVCACERGDDEGVLCLGGRMKASIEASSLFRDTIESQGATNAPVPAPATEEEPAQRRGRRDDCQLQTRGVIG